MERTLLHEGVLPPFSDVEVQIPPQQQRRPRIGPREEANLFTSVAVSEPFYDYDASNHPGQEKHERQLRLSNAFSIDVPFSFSYFLSSEGAEILHMYMWIAKDLSWMLNSYYLSVSRLIC